MSWRKSSNVCPLRNLARSNTEKMFFPFNQRPPTSTCPSREITAASPVSVKEESANAELYLSVGSETTKAPIGSIPSCNDAAWTSTFFPSPSCGYRLVVNVSSANARISISFCQSFGKWTLCAKVISLLSNGIIPKFSNPLYLPCRYKKRSNLALSAHG